jgi:hypothetical protein
VDARRVTARRASGPLSALAQLERVRKLGVEGASGALASAVDAVKSAVLAKRTAEEAARSHAERVASRSGAERQALERGELRASDLVAGEVWQERMASEQRALATRAKETVELELRAADAEHRARLELQDRQVDADLVTRTLGRREAEEQKAAEAAAEQAASEAWRPRS